MIILGIETSCDETAVSIIEAQGDLKSLGFKYLGSAINSQIKIHSEYGGVVPNIAKREHTKNLPIILEEALRSTGLKDLKSIDLIAVTVGPGLEPALWTGIIFAKELSEKWNIPMVPTNHMDGHIVSVLLNKTEESSVRKIEFPILALLISGGHTEFIFLKSWTEKEKIGQTQDDAVGEAFDKVARMLGLPYPGGPEISNLAEIARTKNIVLENKFPRPMLHSKDLNFSFSGLKTSVLYYLKNLTSISDQTKLAVAREFEDAVIETLISKTQKALQKTEAKTLIIGGGVIANKALRENFLKLKETYSQNYGEIEIIIPEKSLTTDNATMIAAAGFIEYLRDRKPNQNFKAEGNLEVS
jgi:N6-L-threonylcarbamoyladenine synthase